MPSVLASPPDAAQDAPARSWRVLRDPPRQGFWNMAMDHALAEHARDGAATLRLYAWDRPTISFGRNEPARRAYLPTAVRRRGFDCVRRPTGGRAVLHGSELTYAVILPLAPGLRLREVYDRVNRALASALDSMGADVELASTSSRAPLDSGPCFRTASRGEILAGGRKVVGSAQARFGRSLLQHGSILPVMPQEVLGELSDRPVPEGSPVPSGAPGSETSIDEVADAITKSLRRELGGTWCPGGYTPDELETAAGLERSRYAEESWTWRR